MKALACTIYRQRLRTALKLWKDAPPYAPHVFKFHQPAPIEIARINSYRPKKSRKPVTYRIDLAYDMIGRNAYALTEHLQTCAVQTNRREGYRSGKCGNSRYARNRSNVPRNFDVYERVCKVTGEWCARFEWRLMKRAARNLMKRHDLLSVLTGAELMELLRREAWIMEIKPRLINESVKRSVIKRWGRPVADEINKLRSRFETLLHRGLLGTYREGEIETMTDLRDRHRAKFNACLQQGC